MNVDFVLEMPLAPGLGNADRAGHPGRPWLQYAFGFLTSDRYCWWQSCRSSHNSVLSLPRTGWPLRRPHLCHLVCADQQRRRALTAPSFGPLHARHKQTGKDGQSKRCQVRRDAPEYPHRTVMSCP
jgi:hypothetical protein